jgi:hypothetical protein
MLPPADPIGVNAGRHPRRSAGAGAADRRGTGGGRGQAGERPGRRIVEGKIKKFVAERTLLEQPFVKNDKITVGELIKEASGKLGETISVRRFARFQVGAA